MSVRNASSRRLLLAAAIPPPSQKQAPPVVTAAILPAMLSVRDSCFYLGMNKCAVYAAIAKDLLKARKVGKRTFILRADLDRFMSELPAAKIRPARDGA